MAHEYEGNMINEVEVDDNYVSHSDYAALERELTELREAVRRLTKADDDLLTLWDAMADNKQLEGEYHAARAAVDALVGEG
jgi:hypothetical protein